MTERTFAIPGGHVMQRGDAIILRVEAHVPVLLEFTGEALQSLLMAAVAASLEKPRRRRREAA